jgi:hypothetical protein
MSYLTSSVAGPCRRSPRRLALIALGVLAFAQAVEAEASTSAKPLRSAERKTLELSARVANLKQAGRNASATSAGEVEELVAVAAERRQLLKGLIRHDPEEFLRLALPARLRDQLPAAVRMQVEQRRDLTGSLAVRYEHARTGTRLVYELDTGKRLVELYFAKSPPRLQSGTRVRARGVMLERSMVIASGEALMTLNLAEDDASASAGSGTTVPPLSNTVGEQRTLVLLVNWLDNPGEQPYDLQQAQNLVFGQVSDFMRENSYGRTWLDGEVHGWFTLPLVRPTDPATTCKQTIVAQAAREAALDAGIDLAAFDRYIYVFPQTSCFPSGTGTVGGSPSETWINGYWFQLKTVAHEVGHNLGLFHAGAQECGATTIGAACQISPYGDTMDIMGNKSAGHFNAFNKERLGWIDEESGTITTAFSGTFTLEAYESAPQSAPKALKVFKDLDPDTGEPSWYYLELRQGLGFDDFLAGNANVTNGVVVRVATETATPSPVSSLLLDMTPASSTSDWQDPALAFGQTYHDAVNGVTLKSQEGAGGAAIVEVGVAQASCLVSAPLLSVSPAEGRWAAPGTGAAYAVSVTNVDSAACAATTLAFQASTPSGWTASVEQASLTLAPGASGEIGLTIISPAGAADGLYTLDVTAERSDGAGAGAAASTSLMYVVSAALANHAPLAHDDSAETSPRTPVVIAVLSNDSDPENDPLTVTAATQGSQGTVQVKSDGTVVYTPKNKAGGEDSFSYTVSDGMAQATAHVRVTNTGTGGGSGKGKGGKP